jgi:hypothetical protein
MIPPRMLPNEFHHFYNACQIAGCENDTNYYSELEVRVCRIHQDNYFEQYKIQKARWISRESRANQEYEKDIKNASEKLDIYQKKLIYAERDIERLKEIISRPLWSIAKDRIIIFYLKHIKRAEFKIAIRKAK